MILPIKSLMLQELDMYIYGTIAYSEGHNGGRAGPVDREGARKKLTKYITRA